MIEIDSRVITEHGEIGIVEETNNDFTTIRYLTPKNEPSCCSGTHWTNTLTPVGEHVVPIGKNMEWWSEANSFFNTICAALEEM